MEEQLYVRIRGRVQGPFDMEKLRALVKLKVRRATRAGWRILEALGGEL